MWGLFGFEDRDDCSCLNHCPQDERCCSAWTEQEAKSVKIEWEADLVANAPYTCHSFDIQPLNEGFIRNPAVIGPKYLGDCPNYRECNQPFNCNRLDFCGYDSSCCLDE
jgi:hypothetical protein